MASTTPNIGLYKKDPVADANDYFNIQTMLNDNWDALDSNQGSLAALRAALGLGATASIAAILTAMNTLISTAQSTANGRARVQTGSYTGTGTYGLSNPNTLTFSFSPKIVFIRKAPDSVTGGYAGNGDAFAVFSQTASSVSEDYSNTVSGSAGGFAGTLYIPSNTYPYAYRLKGKLVNKTLTWCNIDSAKHQANDSGEVYYWTAIE